jgi:hypothetical protein
MLRVITLHAVQELILLHFVEDSTFRRTIHIKFMDLSNFYIL